MTELELQELLAKGEEDYKLAKFLSMLKVDRNERLAASDWTQLPDAPFTPEQKIVWSVYRQSLRDMFTKELPDRYNFPDLPTFN